MDYDAKVPPQLKRAQQWFGSIIGRPIDEDSRMNPISPSGKLMEVEAGEYLTPSPTLRPAQRIQIYNQQYWWRLLNTLHEAFPLLTHIFGYFEFNRSIGIPYFTKYPPQHWSLTLLGESLPKWIEEEYHAKNKELVLNAAKMDWAFASSFVAGQLPPLSIEQMQNEQQMEEILSKKLYTQPHLHLFEMSCNVFKFRIEFLEHPPEYWLEHEIPALEQHRKYFFALYRNLRNEISWKEVAEGEYHLLKLFQEGTTIDMACEWLENQNDETAMNNIQNWFKDWTARGWLSLETHSNI